jgi:hypothetical protein
MLKYIFFHPVPGLIGIGSGLVVTLRSPTGGRVNSLPVLFFAATSMGIFTGFGARFGRLLLPHILVLRPLLILLVTIPAYCIYILAKAWRVIFAVGSSTAPYLKVFALVLHSFLVVPVFHALARTQKGPPLLIAQHIVLSPLIVLNSLAPMKFHPEQTQAA